MSAVAKFNNEFISVGIISIALFNNDITTFSNAFNTSGSEMTSKIPTRTFKIKLPAASMMFGAAFAIFLITFTNESAIICIASSTELLPVTSAVNASKMLFISGRKSTAIFSPMTLNRLPRLSSLSPTAAMLFTMSSDMISPRLSNSFRKSSRLPCSIPSKGKSS